MLDGDARGGRVSEIRHPNSIENSVALVETIVDHIFSDHKSIEMYGLKKSRHPMKSG